MPPKVTIQIGDRTAAVSADMLRTHLLVNVAGPGLALADALDRAGLRLPRVRRAQRRPHRPL